MARIIDGLDRFRLRVETLYKTITLICGFLLLLLMSGNVFVRLVPIASMHWFDEIVELLFAWMVFIGSAVLYSKKEHFLIDWLARKTEGTRIGAAYKILIEVICLAFVAIFLYESARLTVLATGWTAVFNFSKRYQYVAMPLAGLFMTYVSLLEIFKSITERRNKVFSESSIPMENFQD